MLNPIYEVIAGPGFSGKVLKTWRFPKRSGFLFSIRQSTPFQISRWAGQCNPYRYFGGITLGFRGHNYHLSPNSLLGKLVLLLYNAS